MPFSATTADRVKETSTTTGTGDFTLAGAVSQFVTFTSQYATKARFPYAIVGQTGTEWETGIGYLSGASTLVREFPQKGSAAVPVSFSASTKDVFVSIIAAENNSFASKGRTVALAQSLAMN